MVTIKLPKEININLDVEIDSCNQNNFPKDNAKEIKERSKVFSGKDFKF